MRKTVWGFLFLCGVLLCEGAELPVKVCADNPLINYCGRFTDDHQFAWTGCQIEIETDSTAICAGLELTGGQAAGITAVVDGQEQTLIIRSGQKDYAVAEGLSAGRHRIVLFKRNEASLGVVRFDGFRLTEGSQLFEVKKPERKILVIGDSITCAYGNEAKNPKEGNTVENQNGYMSYAAIAARELNAQLMMVCWSGRGMYRNRQIGNDTADTMPKMFTRILPFQDRPEWDSSRFIPDVVVINLGTNDSSTQGGKSPLDKAAFLGAYKEFIARIRTFAPDAKLILSVGPMNSKPVDSWLPELSAEMENSAVLIYKPFSGAEDIGGSWHPSVKKDREMAADLVAKIRLFTDWK